MSAATSLYPVRHWSVFVKFSMIFEAQVEFGTPDVERQAVKNCVEQAVFAEEMGFDGVWAVEHHGLVEYSHMSAPEVLLTAVATRTSRIRVGHAAVCMPFGYNHPVRVAERAATLDIVSDGRLNLGAARRPPDLRELAFPHPADPPAAGPAVAHHRAPAGAAAPSPVVPGVQQPQDD